MSVIGKLAQWGIVFQKSGQLEFKRPTVFSAGVVGPIGNGSVYYLNPGNGSDDYDGKTPRRAFKTMAVAYAALTANQNDVLVYIQDNTSLSIVDTLDWAKDYTHFVGVCPPTKVAQRARIFNSGNTTASTPLLKVSANGCFFSNFYVFQGSAVATVGCVEVTGGRNYFENVHFAGMGHATNAGGANAYSLKLNGADECTFKNCTIGIDTIKRTADNKPLWIDGGSVRNRFEDCDFFSYAETNTYAMVKINDANALDRSMIFKNCLFYNFWENHGGTLLECFDVPANVQTHDIILQDCMLAGIAEWEDDDRGQMWCNMSAPSASAGGIGVEPAT